MKLWTRSVGMLLHTYWLSSICVSPACYKDYFFVISHNLYLDNGPMDTNTAFLFSAIMKETIIGFHYIWELRVFCTAGGPRGDKSNGSIQYLESCYNLCVCVCVCVFFFFFFLLLLLIMLYINPLIFDCTHNTYINWLVMVMKVQNCIFCTTYMHEKGGLQNCCFKIIEIVILSRDFKFENMT